MIPAPVVHAIGPFLLAVAVACQSPPPAPAPSPKPAAKAAEAPAPRAPDPDAALPIPAAAGGRFAADDPTWASADSFRRTPREYGQPSWDHVRGAAAAHLAITGRDLARHFGARGDWKACAEAYTAAAADVRGVPLTDLEVVEVRDLLAADLDRDAGLCSALAANAPPVESGTGLAAWRARVLAVGLRATAGEDVRREAAAMSEALKANAAAGFSPPPPATSASPAEKQLWLARVWGDTVDPLVVTDPWGPWTLDEPRRQAAALGVTLDAIAAGETKSLHLLPAASLHPQPTAWTDEEFSRIALRDSWGDVGGFAMPHVVAQVDLDTAAWTTTNGALAARWGKMREGEVPRAGWWRACRSIRRAPAGSKRWPCRTAPSASSRGRATTSKRSTCSGNSPRRAASTGSVPTGLPCCSAWRVACAWSAATVRRRASSAKPAPSRSRSSRSWRCARRSRAARPPEGEAL